MGKPYKNLPCGHPRECLEWDHDREEPESWCAWCEQVAKLRTDIAILREQLGTAALIVTGGVVRLKCEQIGLLEIKDGGKIIMHQDWIPKITSGALDGLKTP